MTHRLATLAMLLIPVLLLATGCGQNTPPPATNGSPFDDSPITDSAAPTAAPADTAPPAATPAATPAGTDATPAAEPNLLYATGFDDLPDGPLDHDSVTVLDGDWRVARDTTGKYLVLAGEPLREMGLLIGPDVEGSVTVVARFTATAQGRTKPRFGLGLNGAGGYKLRVAAASRQLELVKADEVVATTDIAWTSGRATRLQLTMTVHDDGCRLTGVATTAAGETQLIWQDADVPFGGQAAIYATPYSGTPIQVDDVRITRPD